MFRTVWALFFLNARKTIYVARKRRGQCPCQNPSDSGLAMETGCDVINHWARPDRLQRVCPLLQRNDQGALVCSVAAEEVRPFWGRAFAYVGSFLGLSIALAAGLVYGGMRQIGYEVSLRQVIWPPAWGELRGVRAELFIDQARRHYADGEVREAIQSLTVAYNLNPENYQVGMMLARFFQAGNPAQADKLYGAFLREQPDRRSETARVWFQSLLARGQMDQIAQLAQRQLSVEPSQVSAWTHALLFSTQYFPDDTLLESIRSTSTVPQPVRELVSLTIQTRRLSNEEAARLLLKTPMLKGFAYEKAHRVERLIQLGYPREALALLQIVRDEMASRDFARLVFAAYATMRDRDRLHREVSSLLGVERKITPTEIVLLAVHLVDYPDPILLTMVGRALVRLPLDPAEARLEAIIAVFCAAGVEGDEEQMAQARKLIADTFSTVPLGLTKLEAFFMGKSASTRIERLLPSLNPLPLELNYALLRRYMPVPERTKQ